MIKETPPGQPESGREHPARALSRMINGYWVTQLISTAARLNIADALASMGIFAETEGHRFSLTPMAELLRSDVPGSLHGHAAYSGDPRHHRYDSWGNLYETVLTGEPAFPKITGMRPFAYLAANPDLAKMFDAAMVSYTSESVGAVLAHYDFARFPHLMDVGGGHGRLLAEILKKHPAARGTVFELPHVLEGTRTLFEREGLSGRTSCAAGDFFKEVPAGADLYILKSILHDWDDQKASAILKSCRRAMTAQARLACSRFCSCSRLMAASANASPSPSSVSSRTA